MPVGDPLVMGLASWMADHVIHDHDENAWSDVLVAAAENVVGVVHGTEAASGGSAQNSATHADDALFHVVRHAEVLDVVPARQVDLCAACGPHAGLDLDAADHPDAYADRDLHHADLIVDVAHQMGLCAADHLFVDLDHDALCYPDSWVDHGADRDDCDVGYDLHHGYHLAEVPLVRALDS